MRSTQILSAGRSGPDLLDGVIYGMLIEVQKGPSIELLAFSRIHGYCTHTLEFGTWDSSLQLCFGQF